jgi:predicted ATPase
MLVPKVVITGGPCSGKTTCLKQLSENLAHRGVRVYIATEAATVLFQHGASVTDLSSPTCQRAFQEFVIRFQIQVEDSLVNYALSTSMPSIVLCDRGTMDGAAYIDRESFLNLLQAEGMTEVEARDQRYDAVFHMVTAAGTTPFQVLYSTIPMM